MRVARILSIHMNSGIKHNLKNDLRQADLKATPARLAVLEVLGKEQKPLDAGAIIDLLNRSRIYADQATIFRILNVFTDKGITRQINFNEGKSRYELSGRQKHHHLICQDCGDIEDMSDCPIDSLKREIKFKHGFSVKSHSLEFFGICQKCRH
jgi:Fur family ferric uptake transcriptional regulator